MPSLDAKKNEMGLYVAKTFGLRALAMSIGLVGLIQSLDLIGQSNNILAVPGATEAALLTYVQWRLPILTSQFLPFAILLAALATLATMSHSNQIVIMKASGRSPHQILMPMIFVAAMFAVFHFALNEAVTVQAQSKLDAWQKVRYGADPTPPLNEVENVWAESGPEVIHAAHAVRENGTAKFSDIVLFVREGDKNLRTLMRAATGELSISGGALHGVQEVDATTGEFKEVAERPWNPSLNPDDFFDGPVAANHLNMGNLYARIVELEATGRAVPSLRAALYQKLTWPLASLLMPLLAAIAGFSKGRNDYLALRIAFGLALGFGYFVAESLFMALGRSGTLPPLFGAGVPWLVFLVIGEYILVRSEH